jgi:hypothetical protein
MPSAPLVCRNGAHIEPVKHPEYESGSWAINENDARRLIGGTLHFHESKCDPAYFGGTVTGYDVVETDNARSRRIMFKLTSTVEARGVAWKGRDDTNAFFSGIIE